MSGVEHLIEEIEDEVLSRPIWTVIGRFLLWLLVGIVVAVLLGTLSIALLNTRTGRTWLIDIVEGLEPESGLRIGIGRIDGTLFGKFIIRDLTLADPKGRFLEAETVTVDWEPEAVTRFRLHVNELVAPDIRVLKMPKLLPSKDKNKPILPDYDIYVGRFDFARVILEPAVLGKRQLIRASGSADIADGRLVAALNAISPTGRDALVARIDARPDDDAFALDGRLSAPTDGVTARLLHFDSPLSIDIGGRGSWSKWHGTVRGAYGDARLADLALAANAGKFTVKGKAAPGLVIGGLVRKLGSPSLDVDASASIAKRRIDTTIRLLSPSARIDATGVVDLAESQFEGFETHVRMLVPKALINSLTAKDMQLTLKLEGALATPDFDYRLTADWLALGTTRLDRVVATGKGRKPEGRIEFPMTAKMTRVTGVGDFVEDLATNVSLAGTLRLDGRFLLGDKVMVKSDRVTAIAKVSVDTRTGAYDVDAKGDLPRYLIPGFGVVAVRADLNFIPEPSNPRQLRLRGKVDARVTRLDNDFLLWLFSGLPNMTAHIDRAPSGTIAITGMDARSPDMRIAGNGSYALGQRIEFAGKGLSTRFGPMSVVLDGLISRPRANVHLERYFVGIDLVDVRARFEPSAEAYAFDANADSIAGPVTAKGRILTGPGQTLYEVEAVEIAGLKASGKLRPVPGTTAVTGVLGVGGAGINGTVRLSPENGVQRFDANLTARSARLTLPAVTSIRRGEFEGTLVLANEGADISGRFDLEGINQGRLFLRSAKGTLETSRGEGTAIVIAAGEHGVPFTLDLAASFDPREIVITSKGSIARQAFSLSRPARLSPAEGGWRLAPVTLRLPEGTAEISGTFAKTVSLSTSLNGAGLELIELAVPGIGLTGTASGKIVMTFPPGALPRGTAKLMVKNFSRATEAYSRPVDMAVVALLEANKAVMRAAFENEGKRLGVFQARLISIPGSVTDPWADRLALAPLSAQLRWRGPAEMLWPLTGVGAVSIRGPVAVAVEMSGVLGDPKLTGLVRSRGARMESAVTGTVVDNITLDGNFTGSRLELTNFSGNAGKGKISGNGQIDLSLSRGFPVDLALVLSSADILNRDDLRATASGPLRIRNSPEGALIAGDLTIDKARFRIGRSEQAEVAQLQVKERNSELVRAQPAEAVPTIWKFDIAARGRNQIDVEGMGLESEWSADLDIKGSATQPRLSGTARLVRGDYEFAGRRFALTRGEIRFTGTYPPDPVIDIMAEARVEGMTATIAIRGTGLKPEISFASIPALPEDEVLSRVLFGTSITNLSAPEALQLAGAIASLQGGNGGLNPINTFRKAVGLDRLRVLEANTATGQKTAFAAGEYITNRVYVEVATDAQGYTATQLEFELTRALSILSQVATLGGNSINLRWSKDY